MTWPVIPSTMRITSGAVSRCGMKSVTLTVPSSVSQWDSRTSEPSTYARRVQRSPSAALFGAMSQWPLSTAPRRAAKQAAESKRGRHSQSMDPSRPTRPLVMRSPMSA